MFSVCCQVNARVPHKAAMRSTTNTALAEMRSDGRALLPHRKPLKSVDREVRPELSALCNTKT